MIEDSVFYKPDHPLAGYAGAARSGGGKPTVDRHRKLLT